MSSKLNIEQVDVDGDIRETAHDAAEALQGDTRLSFLKKAGLTGGAVMGGGALLSALTPAASMAAMGKGRPPASFGKGDVGILNYALTLEYLEAAFYNEATANNKKSSFLKNKQAQVFLKTVTADENAHVAYLKKALGSKAVAAPKVDFGSTTSAEASFIKTAVALENTGVHAYSGQATNFSQPGLPSRRRSRSSRSRPARIGGRPAAEGDARRTSPPTARSTRRSPRPKSSRRSKGPASSSSRPRVPAEPVVDRLRRPSFNRLETPCPT